MRPREWWSVLAIAGAVVATCPAPAFAQGDPPQDDVHAGVPGFQGAPGGMARANVSDDDPSLPAGSISVEIRDADGNVLKNVPFIVGMMTTSVAKGESRRRSEGNTGDAGKAVLSGLETGSGMAYRISAIHQGGVYAARPFNLALDKGHKVVFQVFPVTNDAGKAKVSIEAFVFTEIKDDRIQIEQVFRVTNRGKISWVPKDLVLEAPAGFTGFSAQQAMSDVGAESVSNGVKLRGTFQPGQHMVEYRWQLPWSGSSEVEMVLPMPPNVEAASLVAPATQDMKLDAEGFPTAIPERDDQGLLMLRTAKVARSGEDPLRQVRLRLRDLPTAGPGPFIISMLSGAVVALGIGLAIAMGQKRSHTKADTKALREQLLEEMEELERAHAAGDIGPKTYERARRGLIDQIARTLAGTSPPQQKTTAEQDLPG